MIIVGDCLHRMAEMPEASVDAVVTDPPYGLEFMGKEWDRLLDKRDPRLTARPELRGQTQNPYVSSRVTLVAGKEMQDWHDRWATEALRVLKPGGHLLAFGGTRTYHRLACALEDAGFEIRDCLVWMYGSGFPKSLNLSGDWQGWGTALKPAHEPIVLARKPLSGTVAGNVLEHGTGALNVDGCRIAGPKAGGSGQPPLQFNGQNHRPFHDNAEPRDFDTTQGRWPANVLLDPEAAAMLPSEDGVSVARFFLSAPTDTLCVLCGLPCAEIAGNLSLQSVLANATAQGDAQGSERPALEGSGGRNALSASSVDASLRTTSATPTDEATAVSAQTDATVSPNGQSDHGARSAGPLCVTCEIASAQSDAATSPSLEESTSPAAISTHGADSGPQPNEPTPTPSRASTVELPASTGTTNSTTTQPSSSGSASPATGVGTVASLAAYAPIETDLTRFRYQSKASRAERNAGLEGFEERATAPYNERPSGQLNQHLHGADPPPRRNHHPTVKPLALMRWLVRLVTPPGGLVLDPFTGSGTTGIAAALEGCEFMGCEQDAEYAKIAEARIAWWAEHGEDALRIVREREQAEAEREGMLAAGQLELL